MQDYSTQALVESFLNNGVYAAFIPDAKSMMEIYHKAYKNPNFKKIVNAVKLKLVDLEDYHTTVVYSRFSGDLIKKEVDKLNAKFKAKPVKVSGRVNGVAIYGKFLVFTLDKCPVLNELSDHFQKTGATSDYARYQPHISLAKFPSIDSITPEIAKLVQDMDSDFKSSSTKKGSEFEVCYSTIYSSSIKDDDI